VWLALWRYRLGFRRFLQTIKIGHGLPLPNSYLPIRLIERSVRLAVEIASLMRLCSHLLPSGRNRLISLSGVATDSVDKTHFGMFGGLVIVPNANRSLFPVRRWQLSEDRFVLNFYLEAKQRSLACPR
jgi:hypothetical protein